MRVHYYSFTASCWTRPYPKLATALPHSFLVHLISLIIDLRITGYLSDINLIKHYAGLLTDPHVFSSRSFTQLVEQAARLSLFVTPNATTLRKLRRGHTRNVTKPLFLGLSLKARRYRDRVFTSLL